jgi:branched-chain amino acid transport system substrate-binding protein
MMLKWLTLAAATLALFATSLPVRGADAEPFEIDVILSMTGPLTFLGKAEQETLAALEAKTNREGGIRGRPVRFVYHDDKTEPAVAIQLLNQILVKKPSIFLGSTSAASCLAMAPLLAAAGPVEYCLSPAIYPARGSYVFSASVSVRDCWIALIRYFRERGWKRLAVLSDTGLAGRDADANLVAVMDMPENKDAGITVVSHEHFAPADLTVNAQISRIRAAKPDVALLWAAGTPFATVLRGAAEVGLDVPIGASNANLTYVQMKQYASFLPKDLFFPGLGFLARQAPTRRGQAVQKEFFDVFSAAGIRPDFLQNFAWDPGVIAIEALRARGTNATAEQLRSYIANLRGFNGISGEYDFRDGSQRGLSDKNIMVIRWNGDRDTWTAVSRLGGMPVR